MKKKITIKDVADRSGFSITTVSHVINKTRFVKESTRKKVLAVVEDLGYKPNIIAQSLKGKGTKTIGLIISDIREGFFSEIIKSIETSAFKKGYNVILCDSEEKVDEERFYIDVLIRKGIDGLIFSPVNGKADFRDILGNRLPVVQIDRKLENFKTDFVGIDNIKSCEKAVHHLIKEKYRHIGFIGFEERVYTINKRKQGYIRAIDDAGLVHHVLHIPYSVNKIEDNIVEWLKKNKNVDSVICGNDNICYGTISAANYLQIKIPDELGLVSFDDPKWFRFISPPITAISQPASKIGNIAVKILKERIESKNVFEESGFREVFLDTSLNIRKSSRRE